MKKRLMAMLLACAVVLSVAGCNNNGGSGDTTTTAAPAADATTTAADAADTTAEVAAPADFGEQGKVFNIYAWNEEFKGFFETYYAGTRPINQGAIDAATKAGTEVPAAVMYDKAPGIPEGVTVNWIINPSDGGVYQEKLDEALRNQADAAQDDKIDMFLAEADYIYKYTDSSATLDISTLGLSKLDTMYQYTVDAASANGVTKGVSFQCCPAALIYRRSIAKDVLGTDDPTEVQAKLDSWEKFDTVAADAKAKGYYMTGSYVGTYRVYSNNTTSPWVDASGNLSIDAAIKDYITQTKTYMDNGYTLPSGIWDAQCTDQMFAEGKTMCFFGPGWYYNFSMGNAQDPAKGCYGDWAICQGPQAYFWGGTWLLAATGTDNQQMLVDIFNLFTADEDVLSSMVADQGQFVNNTAVNQKFADDPDYGNAFLGGQNDTALFVELAKNIKFENKTGYDQLLNEKLPEHFLPYFNGEATEEECYANFYTYVNETYSAIVTPTV